MREAAMDFCLKLTPTQGLLLRAAARRADGRLIPPDTLRGGARIKEMTGLLRRGGMESCDASCARTGAGYAVAGRQRATLPDEVRTVDATDDLQRLEVVPVRPGTKLDGQDSGTRYRARRLSDGGVMARFHHAVSEAKLSRILRVDLSSPLFTYDNDEKALALARMVDGKLLLVFNVPELTPEAIVVRYKALADIERGFLVLKSEIEIAPVFHRLRDRIRAHTLTCFLALILHRALRMRLKAKRSGHSAESALEISRRIQLHQATLHQRQTTSGITTLTPEPQELFADLQLPKPTANAVPATV
jgi:hypothetical protein